MAKRLIALMGEFGDPGFLRGLGRNRLNVVWIPEGGSKAGFRAGYSGVDWVAVQRGKVELPEGFDVENDRWIGLSAEGLKRPSEIAPEVCWGVLPHPAAVRMLVSVLKQEKGAPEAFQQHCSTLHQEWRQVQAAKALLMERRNWSEPEAYTYLRRLSMNQCRSLEVTAQTIFREYGK